MLTIENIHVHLSPAAASAAAAIFSAQTIAKAQASSIAIPRIGEYWKGQGGVYVGLDRGDEGQPDGHLILPTDPRAYFKNRAVGTKGVDVVGARSERNGYANTVALAEAGSDLCRDIRALEIEGHKDFFLPARFQAALIYANVRELIELGEWYATSTQYDAGSVWFQDFYNGLQRNYDKSASFRARACRRLVL
jgi:hypothetical protein